MKVTSELLYCIHLDKSYSLMTGRNVGIMYEMFKLLDIHGEGMNDIQFYVFLKTITDLTRVRIYQFFDMLDIDGSGGIDFDEFYLLMCILISIKDNEEKQFIYAHSRTVFDLMDDDGSNTISADEFEKFGFLFNFRGDAVRRIFNEFDVSGDQELDYREFRMFAVACVDKQKELASKEEGKFKEKKRNLILKKKKKLLKEINKNKIVPMMDPEDPNQFKLMNVTDTQRRHSNNLSPFPNAVDTSGAAPRWSVFNTRVAEAAEAADASSQLTASATSAATTRWSIFSNFIKDPTVVKVQA